MCKCLFRVRNKDTRTTSYTPENIRKPLVFYVFLKCRTLFPVFIFDFEQVIALRVIIVQFEHILCLNLKKLEQVLY